MVDREKHAHAVCSKIHHVLLQCLHDRVHFERNFGTGWCLRGVFLCLLASHRTSKRKSSCHGSTNKNNTYTAQHQSTVAPQISQGPDQAFDLVRFMDFTSLGSVHFSIFPKNNLSIISSTSTMKNPDCTLGNLWRKGSIQGLLSLISSDDGLTNSSNCTRAPPAQSGPFKT